MPIIRNLLTSNEYEVLFSSLTFNDNTLQIAQPAKLTDRGISSTVSGTTDQGASFLTLTDNYLILNTGELFKAFQQVTKTTPVLQNSFPYLITVSSFNRTFTWSSQTVSQIKAGVFIAPNNVFPVGAQEQLTAALTGIPIVQGEQYSTIQGIASYHNQTEASGIQVTLLRVLEGLGTVVQKVVTPASGAYVFSKVELGNYTVLATQPDSLEKAIARDVSVQRATVIDLGELKLTPTGSISGTVLLESAANHEGTLIYLLGTAWSAYSDEQGGFTFQGVPVGTYSLKITHPQYASTTPQAIEVIQFQEVAISAVTLPRSSAQETQGTDPAVCQGGLKADISNPEESATGRLLRQARSWWTYGRASVKTCRGCIAKLWPENSATVDAPPPAPLPVTDLGSFEAPKLPPNIYRLEIVSEDGKGLTKEGVVVKCGQTTNAGSFELAAMGSISGQVTLADNPDATDIQITIPGTSYSATTDADGKWKMTLVPEGNYRLRYAKAGYVKYSAQVQLSASQDRSTSPVVLTTAFGTITGTVQLEGLENQSSTLIALGSTGDVVLADAEGKFRFSQVPEGNYTLFFYSPGFKADKAEDVTVTAGNKIALESLTLLENRITGNMVGTLRLENDANPAGTTILVLETGQTTVVNSQGGFLLSEMYSGSYSLEITKENFEVIQRRGLSIITGVTTKLTSPITLPQARGTLQGITRLEGSTDHSGITVQLQNTPYQTTTTVDGSYSFVNVPVGAYNMNFSKSAYLNGTQDNNKVTQDTITKVPDTTLKVEPAKLSGFVTLASAASHEGISITLRSGDFSDTVSTDAQGAFTLGVPPGTYTLIATYGDLYLPQTVDLSFQAAEVKTLTTPLMLQRKTGSLRGTVLLKGQSTHAGITVNISGNSTLSATTDAAGNFTLTNLPTGDYNLSYSIAKYQQGSAENQKVAYNSQTAVPAVVFFSDDSSPTSASILIEGVSGTATSGFSQTLIPAEDGSWSFDSLPLGEYTLTQTHGSDSTWESVVSGVSIVTGDEQTSLPVALRKVFVSIDNGAVYTTSANVTLSLGGTRASEMRIGNTLGGGSWETFASSKAWTLPQQGNNTVYVTFRDAQAVEIPTVSDSILLDSVATISVVTENTSGATKQRGDTLRFTLSAGETGGTATVDIEGYKTGLSLHDDGLRGDATAGDGIYTSDYLLVSGTDTATASVTGHFTDRYGNVASTVDAVGTITIGTPPQLMQIQVVPSTDAQSAIIRWLTDEATNTVLEYGTTDSYGSTENTAESVTSHEVTLNGLSRGTTYHYQVQATDTSNNQTVSSDHTFRVAPALTVGVNAFAGDSQAVLVWSPNTEENLVGYHVYRSTTSGSGFVKITSNLVTTIIYTDSGLSNGVTYYYQVSAIDSYSIESALSGETSVTPGSITAEQNVSGVIDTNTVWASAGNPWNVTGDLVITSGSALFILPGTTVVFRGAFKIRVEGELQVLGSSTSGVTLSAASGQQWKGLEWISGSIGSTFNSSDVYVSGSALRYVTITGAGALSSQWLRTENASLYLEGATLGGCSSCVTIVQSGTLQPVVFKNGSWSNISGIAVTGSKLVLDGVNFNTVTLAHSGGTLPGTVKNSQLTSSTITTSGTGWRYPSE
ncbi:carboxypeptidase regulatory-like domain-containing protein [Deltaproteobacteria bacterium TL4]